VVPTTTLSKAADEKWDEGDFDVTQLAAYLSGLLKAQLSEAV
jgi:hypothetical protein